MKRSLIVIAILTMLLFVQAVLAQETVTVPDITGMSAPAAAALLNDAGLRLGTETAVGWTAESGLEPNTISQQSLAPGQSAARGSAVDVTVLRAPNVAMIYDDNDITLANLNAGTLSLGNITFNAVDGSQATAFTAGRVPASQIDTGECAQVWSVGRVEPKRLPECTGSIFWLTTNNRTEHFWTGANSTTQFAVYQDGIQRAVCTVANPGSCTFYLSGGGSSEVTEYVYFAYTRDKFILYNQSPDQFMPLPGLQIFDARGSGYPITTPGAYGDAVIADVTRLAPGQCIHILNNAEGGPPQPCNVVAEASVNLDYIFWYEAFTMTSLTDGEQRTCPGATEGRLTLCILPR